MTSLQIYCYCANDRILKIGQYWMQFFGYETWWYTFWTTLYMYILQGVVRSSVTLSLCHNCDSIAIRQRYDYDEKLTFFFACIELEAGARDTS